MRNEKWHKIQNGYHMQKWNRCVKETEVVRKIKWNEIEMKVIIIKSTLLIFIRNYFHHLLLCYILIEASFAS